MQKITTHEQLAQRISEIKEEKGLSQYRICKDADIKPATLNTVLREGKCTLNSLLRIMEVMGLEMVIQEKITEPND